MIAIVDYGMGNLGSVQNMLRKIGAESVRTSDPSEIAQADDSCLPGSARSTGRWNGWTTLGLVAVLNERVIEQQVPILGVCLGMQVMARSSDGGHPSRARLARCRGPALSTSRRIRCRCPHMGWEVVVPTRPSPLFDPTDPEPRFYFSHAYHLVCHDPADVAATATYGYEFAAAVHRGNILGTQFHPEKSHVFGLDVYRRFLELSPE